VVALAHERPRIAELRARVDAIAADVAFRDAHAPQPNAHRDKPFSFVVDGRVYSDRVQAAPAFAAVIDRGVDESFAAGQATGSCPSTPIAAYRGFEVTVRPATSGTIRLGLRCPERSDALEYATARTLDVAQVPAYGIGLFQRLDHLFDALDAELKAAQDGLAREVRRWPHSCPCSPYMRAFVHFRLRSSTSMAEKVALDKAWAEAAQRCRLSPADVRMANELGFKLRSLLKNQPSPQRAAAPATRTRAGGNDGPDKRRPFCGHSNKCRQTSDDSPAPVPHLP